MCKAEMENQERQLFNRYEIRIKGHIDALWAERLAGMTLRHEADGTTTLSGMVIDQSALHGILRTIRDLGMTLLNVTRLEPPASSDASQATEIV